MVSGKKMKLAMGLSRPSTPPPSKTKSPPPSASPSSSAKPTPPSSQKTVFTRSYGVYFPRSSAQVQPRPPDVTELLNIIETLRERESRLKTQLLEQKLLNESAAVLPILELEVSTKNDVIGELKERVASLESQNAALDAEVLKLREECKKLRNDALRAEEASHSQRFQGSLLRNLKRSKTVAFYNESSKKEEAEQPSHSRSSSDDLTESASESTLSSCASSSVTSLSSVRSRVPHVPKPPPKPMSVSSPLAPPSTAAPPPPPPPPPPRAAPKPPILRSAKTAPPPPPPPPPMRGTKSAAAKVTRVPEVVEFYHSLMRRDSRKDACSGEAATTTNNARDMIGEIENRSAHLLAIKTDVETQGDFIKYLIKEVENAAFTNIDDVVPFVKWLDDELSYLVDERAVLKHFDWPEQKADALREAAFGYSDLKKLVSEISSFTDDARQPCAPALKKMQSLYEKLEHGVYDLSRMRESVSNKYKLHHIPTDWMLETGCVSQIKLASVKLAMKYIKRVSAELENVDGGSEEEELIVQGVRFAFRVHQFAGGFDVETMKAFQELREKAKPYHDQQQKYLNNSTAS